MPFRFGTYRFGVRNALTANLAYLALCFANRHRPGILDWVRLQRLQRMLEDPSLIHPVCTEDYSTDSDVGNQIGE